jgi:hypothetical protein
MRNAYKTLFGKPEGNRPRGRLTRKWEDDIRMNLREIGWTGFIWLGIGTNGGIL